MPQFDVHFLTSSVFWSVVSFAILLYLLAKYALPPVLKTLDEREQSIRQTINEAQRLKVEGENLIKEYEEKLAAIRKESQEILDGARLQAQRLLETNERETKARAEKILSDAKEEIERETARAIREVRGHAASLALAATEQILRKKVDDGDQRRLVEDFLRQIEAGEGRG